MPFPFKSPTPHPHPKPKSQNTIQPKSSYLSYTLDPYTPFISPWPSARPKSPTTTLRRSFRSFVSSENLARQLRNEVPFATPAARDAAFEKLMRLSRGEEEIRWEIALVEAWEVMEDGEGQRDRDEEVEGEGEWEDVGGGWQVCWTTGGKEGHGEVMEEGSEIERKKDDGKEKAEQERKNSKECAFEFEKTGDQDGEEVVGREGGEVGVTHIEDISKVTATQAADQLGR